MGEWSFCMQIKVEDDEASDIIEFIDIMKVKKKQNHKFSGYHHDDYFTEKELKFRDGMFGLFSDSIDMKDNLDEFSKNEKEMFFAIEGIFGIRFYITYDEYLEILYSFRGRHKEILLNPNQLVLVRSWIKLREFYLELKKVKEEVLNIQERELLKHLKGAFTSLSKKSYSKVMKDFY